MPGNARQRQARMAPHLIPNTFLQPVPSSARPPIIGETATTGFWTSAGRIPRTARMGSTLTHGLEGQITIISAAAQGFWYPGCRTGLVRTAKSKSNRTRLALPFYKIILKVQLTLIGEDPGGNGFIAHRQHEWPHTPGLAESPCNPHSAFPLLPASESARGGCPGPGLPGGTRSAHPAR